MTTVEQIVYTAETERWHLLAAALGLVAPFAPTDEWSEFDGDGVLAVHHAYDERPPGTSDVHLLVDDLGAATGALSGFAAEGGEMAGVGPVLTVRTAEGVVVTVSQGADRDGRGTLAVEPIWFQRDIAEPRRILEALGFRAGIVGERGGWAQLAAPGGGSIGLHGIDRDGDAARIEASFRENGDLDTLAARVRAAGFDAAVIDESYGRTLRMPAPDGGDEIWINGVQDDLYGYRREGVVSL